MGDCCRARTRQHDDIATQGRGSFSHWRGALYFSTFDGSDPNRNGRKYRLLITHLMWPSALGRRITGPFALTNRGWIGFVPNPPRVWKGAQLHLVIDGTLAGAVELLPENRVCIGLEDRARNDIEAAFLHVIAAEQRELAPPFTHKRGLMWAAQNSDLAPIATT